MTQILIAYDSTEGETRKIAQHMADAVSRGGHDARVVDIRRLPSGFSLDSAEAVLFGASVHLGKHSRHALEFVSRHRAHMETLPSGFFSVSLSAAGSEKERADAARFVEEFLQQTAWNPTLKTTFAGALRYREYNFLKRWIMKKIAKDAGKETDTSRNHEYTDWDAVDRFVAEFLQYLETE